MDDMAINDFIMETVDSILNGDDWTRSDLQGYVEAWAEGNDLNADEILNSIDSELYRIAGIGI